MNMIFFGVLGAISRRSHGTSIAGFNSSALWLLSLHLLGMGISAANAPVRHVPARALEEIGANHKVWGGPADGGGEKLKSGRIVEIETGMNYWNGSEWTSSDASFEV